MGRTSHARVLSVLILSLSVVAIVVLAWPRTATAQCGSSASSCKNCHEVQGVDPVNSEGEWHTAHAFGDFCEFCHAGNVQAMEQEAAHVGLVHPLQDVNASCLSCHPDNTQEKAQLYAVALGVELNNFDGGAGNADDESNPPAAPAAREDTSGTEAEMEGGVAAEAPDDAVIVDYNRQYEQTVLGQGQGVNAGNAILAGLWFLVTVSGAVLVWRWEGLGQRWRALRSTAAQADGEYIEQAPVREGARPAGQIRETEVAQVDALAAQLAALDEEALDGLRRLLAQPEQATQILTLLARLDPRLIGAMRHLDTRDRALLVALVEGLESAD